MVKRNTLIVKFITIALLLLGPLKFAHSENATGTVKVSHALGISDISPSPHRVITLGWSGEDVVLALGTVPIAMTRYGSFPSGMFPWDEAKLTGERPLLLSGDLNYETIAALKPDLILGIYSGIDAVAYKRLSAIAPTVVYRSGPWQADWREQTEIIGEALGKSKEAQALIAETEALLEGFGNDYPELQGKTFTFGSYMPGSSSLIVYLPSDPRVQALTKMGLKISSGVEALATSDPDETSTSVSLENIGSIDADILIMWYGEGARNAAETQPLFAALNSVKRGSYVALDDPVSVWSTSALSVLSIPYGFPKFVPRLAEAARKAERQ
ncbi:iron-siderophore ABC transporter substrate-binding protein [Brucella pseudogrignonensis]|uniref:Iron complex transport system substrate-binding protein n=1 Tax=Brucella pseudogrignonensis TaxID=419475 RepID=A0ABU1MDC3_9HYPH|nr:iron-siderophore ABC transporter substrate-binding protein [Brucella pseudogrignonensis]MDR6433908.1 iron complex transport system substrate-binding protein [Brucella pseudogrignonensis]